jgi:hypothetical protein
LSTGTSGALRLRPVEDVVVLAVDEPGHEEIATANRIDSTKYRIFLPTTEPG